MEKLVLKDETELIVVNPFEYSFQMAISAEEMVTTFNSLTAENLAEFTLQDEKGDVMAMFENKKPKSCTYENGIATFCLADVDKTEQRLAALEDTIDILLLEDMGV